MRKTILWIDDFDTNSSKATRSRRKNNSSSDSDKLQIFNEKYRKQVEIKTTFFEGMRYIIEKHGEYDCVILDIDMNKNFQQIELDQDTDESKIWNKFFKYVKIEKRTKKEGLKTIYTYGKRDISLESYIGKYAGFFLVILLIALGFPQDRIVIFSAFGNKNEKDNRVERWEDKFVSASIHIPKIIDKEGAWNREGGTQPHIELNEFLNEKYNNEYYKTRFFVYELYNVVNEYLDNILSDDDYKGKYNPLFNYCCQRGDKKLGTEQIKNLYENSLFFFPCFEPHQGIEKNYFNALKQFSEPFEADYRTDRVKDNSFRVIKLFRNWSAHNLFDCNDCINAEIFKFLYYIESLLFMEQPCIENPDNSNIYNYSKAYIDEMWSHCKYLLGEAEVFTATKIDEICHRIEKDNWAICQKYNILPEKMVDIYDMIGRKDKVHYTYLLDAFMNNFINKNIKYTNNGCETQYEFSQPITNEAMKKELFYLAYFLYMQDKKES